MIVRRGVTAMLKRTAIGVLVALLVVLPAMALGVADHI